MFKKLLLYNFGSQLFARVISFIINLNFYRVIDGDLLGLINVQLTLMYNTALFLSREPVRRTVLANNGKYKDFTTTMWISFGLSVVFGVVLSGIWMITLRNVSSVYEDEYFFMIFIFFLSIVVEGFTEPFAMSCMKLNETERFLIAQGILVFLQKVSSAILIFIFKTNHVGGLCYGQLIGSIGYLVYFIYFWYNNSIVYKDNEIIGLRTIFNVDFKTFWYSKDKNMILSYLFHSLIKQIITDTSGYVMTFTKALSLKEQATYDAVEKIGSLAVRIILKPLEETAQIFYNSKPSDQKKEEEHEDDIFRNFKTSIKNIAIVGFVIGIFSSPYSGIGVRILLGENLLKYANGALLLSTYAKILVIMAINGLTECLAMSLMNEVQISKHGIFLFGLGISNIITSIVLSKAIGSIGFIFSNGIHMVIRILYSCYYIDKIKQKKFRPFSDYYINRKTVSLLIMSMVLTQSSYYIFEHIPGGKVFNILGIVSLSLYDIIHIIVGIITLMIVSLFILNIEYPHFKISRLLSHRKSN
uniref:Protein RFT1 homolog n=1 Tax=Strongyloides papillosus TaxID=174720 RepID=A0A0N5BHW3_STREA